LDSLNAIFMPNGFRVTYAHQMQLEHLATISHTIYENRRAHHTPIVTAWRAVLRPEEGM
jgi:hypothetical protein